DKLAQLRFQAVAAPTIRSSTQRARYGVFEPTGFGHPPPRRTTNRRATRIQIPRLESGSLSVQSGGRSYARSIHGAVFPFPQPRRDERRFADNAGRAV